MADKIWTYETLAQADAATYESILKNGTPPDLEQLYGYIYCGWNHEWIGHVSGKKFKKAFYKKDGQNIGFNEIVIQDYKTYLGDWKVMLINNRPIQLGYFRTALVKDEPPQPLYEPYKHLGHFNYNLSLNTGPNLIFRFIRDFVVLPNPGDHSLMLCKAYLQFARSLNVFYCYFLLGHRQEIKYLPWWALETESAVVANP